MNKKIIATMCGLATVAIATVGFSAWVVGVHQSETTSETSVAVDVVTNDTQYLAAELSSDKIVVAESEVHVRSGNDIIGANNNGTGELQVSTNALKFSFSKLEVVLGDNVNTDITGVKISLDSEVKNKFLVTETNYVGRDVGTSWSYLKFADVTLSLSKSDLFTIDSSNDGYDIYTLNTESDSLSDFSLSWGTYFNNVSPVNYYNSLYKTTDTFSTLLERSQNASNELQQMHNVLTTNTITFDLTLV